jgi:hypothetical protein
MSACKFHGTLDDLRAIVEATGVPGGWRELLNGHHQFRTADGGVMNWWSSTQTIHFQGAPGAARSLQRAIWSVVALQSPQRPLRALPEPRE